jgi:TATA-box binding protein (TBP) (component of TFIID and TFIIIB)
VAETRDIEIVIQNVVASATLDQKFNLIDIIKTFRNVEYNPRIGLKIGVVTQTMRPWLTWFYLKWVLWIQLG